MFRKPIKIKSNTPVKGTERKNIKEKIQKQYPILSEVDLENLLPKKANVNSVKILTASNETIHVFTVHKRPVCFEHQGKLFPSVYLLWQYPNLVHNFTTHKEVFTHINSGADLMLPGVLTPPAHTGLPKYGNALQKNSIVAVNLISNKASIAVGVANMSSVEMGCSGGRGKCVSILHIYGDNLCTLENQPSLPIPSLGPQEWLEFKRYNEDFPMLGGVKENKESLKEENNESIDNEKDVDHNTVSGDDPQETKINDVECSTIIQTTETEDELLRWCFMNAIKYSKTLSLPILTSNFYKLQLLGACLPNKTLDIKKTSYKKLKPFLDEMCREGFITMKEVKKGVESIESINRENPVLHAFYVSPGDRPGARNETDTADVQTTDIIETYVITQSVLPVFNSGLTKRRKGDQILGKEVRTSIREYINNNKCQHENPRLICPDETLSVITKTTNPITWEELYEKVCSSMRNCFKVKTGLEEILNKGKISPIVINVGNRSGNKKVTLVENLELYGIRVPEFAKECQHGVAASTTIIPLPGKKTEQVLVQGNQVLFVYNLLTEKYKIPKRYIRGLENAPKNKK